MRERVMSRLAHLAVVAVVVALAGTSARAQDSSGDKATDPLFGTPGSLLEKSNKIWAQSDTCGKESFQKFPDYTVEGATKRNAYMRECLRKNRLPPRNDLAQPLEPRQ